MTKFVDTTNQLMNRAWMRDGKIIYSGEPLLIACLLHVKGKTSRGREEMETVSRLLKDPNLKD